MSKIDEIMDAFREADYQDTLAMLLDYSESLPPLPAEFEEARDAGYNRVVECETPVFIWVDVKGDDVTIYADVPPESPTVRGFVSLLLDAFTGSSPEEIIAAPPDLLNGLGLAQKLGTRRMFGLSAVYNRIKSDVRKGAGLQ